MVVAEKELESVGVCWVSRLLTNNDFSADFFIAERTFGPW